MITEVVPCLFSGLQDYLMLTFRILSINADIKKVVQTTFFIYLLNLILRTISKLTVNAINFVQLES